MRKIFLILICLVVIVGIDGDKAKGDDMIVEKGKKISFDYTLTVDGEVVDTSKERGPLSCIHGEGQIIPGLADKLTGMKVGEEKTVEVSPEGAYGNKNPEAFKEISKTSLPEGLEPKVDMMLQMQGPGGQAVPVRVSEVKNESIVIDLNHPLAGKTLTFDVKIVSIE